MAKVAQTVWVVLLVVFVIAACSVERVSSEEETKENTLQDHAVEAGRVVKTWMDWAVDRSSAAYDSAKKQAIEWSGQGTASEEGALETAKKYASDGAQQLYTTSSQMQEHIGGYFNKWRSWAQEKASQYKSGAQETAAKHKIVEKITNPSDAFAYINTHASSDEEEL